MLLCLVLLKRKYHGTLLNAVLMKNHPPLIPISRANGNEPMAPVAARIVAAVHTSPPVRHPLHHLPSPPLTQPVLIPKPMPQLKYLEIVHSPKVPLVELDSTLNGVNIHGFLLAQIIP
uniref:Uncharacterized protein n=1 Tax=Steinernema glaseri TaxID=37863 RepID=A0A1I7YCU6_9BILA